jgi:hypothetical protein
MTFTSFGRPVPDGSSAITFSPARKCPLGTNVLRYTAALFGNDHIQVVPRLEKTVELLERLGVPFTVHEWVDGEREQISIEVMRQIIESAEGEYR